MPRYRLNTVDGGRDRDAEGHRAGRRPRRAGEAVRYAGAVLSHEPQALWDGRECRVEVTNDTEEPLVTIVALAVDASAGAGKA